VLFLRELVRIGPL